MSVRVGEFEFSCVNLDDVNDFIQVLEDAGYNARYRADMGKATVSRPEENDEMMEEKYE